MMMIEAIVVKRRQLLTAALMEQRGALVRSMVGMSLFDIWIA